MAQSGTPPPTPLTNFSSDLDESQNRSLGQVGGRVPPVPPWLRHWQPPIFGLCLLWPNGWMDQDAT